MRINPLFARLAVLLAAILLSCCATPPPARGRADLLDFIEDQKATKEEVLLKLGQPSTRFAGEKIFTYQVGLDSKSKGYYVVERVVGQNGWLRWNNAKYSLVLVFDEQGVLVKHSLVEVN